MIKLVSKMIGSIYFYYAKELAFRINDLPIGISSDIYIIFKRFSFFEKLYNRIGFVPIPFYIILCLCDTSSERSIELVKTKSLYKDKKTNANLDEGLQSKVFYEKYFKDDFRAYYEELGIECI